AVDFAATDAPLKDDELAAGGFMQFPIVGGGIVPVTNIPQARDKRVRLDGETLAQIFAGKITRWDDARIKALNHAFALPAEPITVVHRGDSSGITYNFTAYLSHASDGWRATLGTGKTVKWPVGVPAEGNTGLGQRVTQTPNSIGYVEYGYALQHEMQIVALYTSGQRPISPTQTTIRNAVESAPWGTARNFNLLLVGIAGDDTWPIAATTWVVLPKSRRASLDFLRWALERGDHAADALGYTPIPPGLVGLIEASWKSGAATGSAP
ncbi:MAG TPA: phosphate ABC transporter substrate-binding protein PstS, partial [Tahibacter sp.]|nr:phosphate ABC transporter substrate-binding protein PstS [Tahibacter sp.]